MLQACQGQLRIASSGQVIGIDLGVALQMAIARGYDVAVLSALMPAVEAGMFEALSLDSQGSG